MCEGREDYPASAAAVEASELLFTSRKRPQSGLSLWCQSTAKVNVLNIPAEDFQTIVRIFAAGYLRLRACRKLENRLAMARSLSAVPQAWSMRCAPKPAVCSGYIRPNGRNGYSRYGTGWLQ